MKKLNRILVLVVVIALALPMLNSCKKGENDPTISLKSRSGRLKGEWKLVEGTESGSWGGDTYTMTYTETMATQTYSGQSATWMHTETIEFLSDNEFKATTNDDGDIETTEGFWAFMDGYDEVADKQMVVIRISSYTSSGTVQTYSGDDMPMGVLNFNKLSSSEAIIVADGTSMSGGNTSTSTSEKTYEKQ